MYLQRLSLIHFKNIREADLAFCGKLNCLVGDNGTGKTNLIDAIHYLSLCKSAFNLTDGQSVNHGADFFTIEGKFTLGQSREEITCAFKKGGGKIVRRNGKEYEKLSEHIGLLPVVLVSPSDTSLIHESGEDRRKFLNTLLSQLDREYLHALIRYNRILAERNKLLKQLWSGNFEEILEVLDRQLIEAGERVYAKRRELVEKLAPIVEKYYAVLSDDREQVQIAYKSELNETPFEELLRGAYEKDRILQHTTVGIHRDDIRMTIGGYPLRKYGSQGEQKSFLVALKLAQFEVIADHSGYKPILLLDDIFDKLDMERVRRLIRLVSDDRFGQIFITDSNKVRLDSILQGLDPEFRLFTVEDGVLSSVQ
ncbi:MAG: DNA replication/repair protein RecF [Rikenellaceae bacterium]|jgi:DNA replication and repair protein RecF|nr:DNA replication/repair protein RecF [Rikenellaceae bacterium]